MTPLNIVITIIIKATIVLVSAYNMSGIKLSAFQILSLLIPSYIPVWYKMLFPFFWMKKLKLKNKVSSGVEFLTHRWRPYVCLNLVKCCWSQGHMRGNGLKLTM